MLTWTNKNGVETVEENGFTYSLFRWVEGSCYEWAAYIDDRAYGLPASLEEVKARCQSRATAIQNQIDSEVEKAVKRLRDALETIAKDSPKSLPEDNRGCGNEDDAYMSGADREHYRLASIAIAALTKPEEV